MRAFTGKVVIDGKEREMLSYRPIKLETVVVMRGDKVVGTIKRYRAHNCCIVNVPCLLTASMAIGKGNSVFRTIGDAKRKLNELERIA